MAENNINTDRDKNGTDTLVYAEVLSDKEITELDSLDANWRMKNEIYKSYRDDNRKIHWYRILEKIPETTTSIILPKEWTIVKLSSDKTILGVDMIDTITILNRTTTLRTEEVLSA